MRRLLIPALLVCALALTGCTNRWVADWHTGHGHQHRTETLQREADIFTAYWAAVPAWLAARTPAISNEAAWDRVAACESGGRWNLNTGSYDGGLQFLPSTWWSVGGTGYAWQHSKAEQIHRAEILKSRAGLGQWPVCGSRWYG